MDSIKTQLIEIINTTNPKQVSAKIKKHQLIYTALQPIIGNTIAEKAYNFLNPGEQVCSLGQYKKFNSITTGYRYCGNAKMCQCARQSVSESVTKAKQDVTAEQQQVINKKRQETTMQKYGVTNNGQTKFAKDQRKEVYANADRVSTIVEKISSTKQDRYNNKNYNNSEQIKKTFRQKQQDGFWIQKFPTKNISVLENKEELAALYQTTCVEDIASMLNVHIQTVYSYLNRHDIREPFKSSEENEICTYLSSIGVNNIVRNSRSLIPSKKEIDIFLPDYQIAIEYNGIYWHHEDIDHITRSYHYDKFKQCSELDIQLITIFSNFWKSKKDIVKQTLVNKLGLNSKKVFARQCTIRPVTTKDASVFLNLYHIQGTTPSSIRLGLYYKNTLEAIMTFSNSRIGIGKQEEGYELVRFASKSRVVGGASKLLSYFIKTYSPTKIISYSDNEWSTGNLYASLGFILEKEIAPSYWYIKPREERLYHRFNFAKHKLVKLGYATDRTERDITREMGLLKIWDCGKKRWVLTFD